jgi:DNA mismatch endonuclease (patch repair protein)
VDRVTPEQRSRNMSRIRARDTKPEKMLRSALHRAGLRFRVCRNDLPGRPDVVFARQMLAIQVRGCFWHQHEGCSAMRVPASNVGYWAPKLRRTVERDAAKDEALRALGWQLLVVWECELRPDSAVALVTEQVRAVLAGRRRAQRARF